MINTLLAIDIGTQSTRALVITATGTILAKASYEYGLQTPHPGWAQQDAEEWWQATVATIQSVLQQSGVDPGAIACVAVDSQMHATIPIDRAGQVIAPAVQLWCDKRAAGEIAAFERQSFPVEPFTLAGNQPTTAWQGFKIRWMQHHQPEIFARAWKIVTASTFVVFRLTEMLAISYAEASGTYCMDATRETWSDDLIHMLGINADHLPPIAPATSVIGRVTDHAARLTGLRAGTPVAVGAADFIAAALSSGLTKPGDAAEISGTSCLMAVVSEHALINPALMNLHHEIDGWVSYGVVETGGGALRWFRDQCCYEEIVTAQQTGQDVYTLMVEGTADVSPGADGVLFFPYLLGERLTGSPYSRGVFFGLHQSTDRRAMIRAILEGITFDLRRTLDTAEQAGVRVEQIRATGGGAQSDTWNQIRADIYNKPVVTLAGDEGSLTGTAILAGLTVGLWPDATTACDQLTQVRTVYEPRPDHSERYAALYEEFKALHDAFIPGFERLHRTLNKGR